jgi:hypothetical protein
MYRITNGGVIRLTDNAMVPADVRNTDWQAYQEWLAAGNTPEPAFVPEMPPVIRTISVFAFRSRFLLEEKRAIYVAAAGNIDIRIWLDDLQAATEVDLDHPQTVEGVNALEQLGLIGAGRAAKILA